MGGVERFLLTGAALVIIVAGIRAAASLIVPLLLAIFITIILTPAYLAMRNRGISNFTSLLVLLILLSSMAFAGVNLVGQSIRDFTQKFPQYQKALVAQRDALFQWLEARHVDPEKLRLAESLDPRYLMRYAGTLVSMLSNLIGQTFVVFLIVVFMLLELTILPTKLTSVPHIDPQQWEQLKHVVHNVRRYVAIKTFVSFATGLLIGLWCWLIGLDQVFLLGLLAFMLNYIPTIGSVVAAIPALLISLTMSGLGKAALCAIGYLLINISLGSILEPRLMGKRLGLSPLIVFISIFFWGWVLGPAGMLFSVPLTMVLKIVLQHHPRLSWIATILGSGTELRPIAPSGGENVSTA